MEPCYPCYLHRSHATPPLWWVLAAPSFLGVTASSRCSSHRPPCWASSFMSLEEAAPSRPPGAR
jgi:hypothetical protein